MSNPMTLYLDSHLYNVNVDFPSLKRKFKIEEGPNSGQAVTGKYIRDILGTRHTFTMTVRANPDYPTDYDLFYDQIQSPVDSHIIQLPYGQGIITLYCAITDGEDVYKGYYAGYNRWDEMSLTLTNISVRTSVPPVTPGFDTWTIGGSY